MPNVRTVAVTEGDIVDTIGATGALEAVTTVQVGSQVSGIIQELYVDFNSIVREGDVIMRLDPSLFETQLEQARANLLRSEAEVERSAVGVDDAVAQLRRARELAAGDLISETELEAATVALRSAEAQLKSAEAQVRQSKAALRMNEVNLEHTVIRAPIDGIVTARLVDVGQTVAASFQAPELFVIAADLTKMRVVANIDESDVGRIRPNQRVTFTVDAYPAEEFEGTVSQIRLEPIVTQNVVTYATVIDAPNPELKLKLGMTATVTVEVARRENVVRIPNAALRFRPTPAMFEALGQAAPPRLSRLAQADGTAAGRPDGLNGTEGRDTPNALALQRGADTIDALFAPIEWEDATGRVWFMDGARLSGLDVRLGITDGSASELLGVVGRPRFATGSSVPAPSLPNGLQLVTNVATTGADTSPATGNSGSPLMPQSPLGRRGR